MVRAGVVIGLAALVLGLTLPNLWLTGRLGSVLSVSVNSHFDVMSSTPGSLADRAGLRVGDHAAAELRRRLDEALRARGPIAQPAG
jgi:hypothetical protein